MNKLQEEAELLQTKVHEIRDYISTEEFEDLSEHHQGLILAQQRYMVKYLNTLHLRINLLDQEEEMQCFHVDTCSPDYWRGTNVPYVSIEVWDGMDIEDIKQALITEINTGIVLNGKDEDLDYYLTAVANLTGHSKNGLYFEEVIDDCGTYAYFIFTSRRN